MHDPRIIAQNSDPRFAQQNPRMVRIRTLRLTYIYVPSVRPSVRRLIWPCEGPIQTRKRRTGQ